MGDCFSCLFLKLVCGALAGQSGDSNTYRQNFLNTEESSELSGNFLNTECCCQMTGLAGVAFFGMMEGGREGSESSVAQGSFGAGSGRGY